MVNNSKAHYNICNIFIIEVGPIKETHASIHGLMLCLSDGDARKVTSYKGNSLCISNPRDTYCKFGEVPSPPSFLFAFLSYFFITVLSVSSGLSCTDSSDIALMNPAHRSLHSCFLTWLLWVFLTSAAAPRLMSHLTT